MIWKSLKMIHYLNKKYIPFVVLGKILAVSQLYVNIIMGSVILDMVINRQAVPNIMRLVIIMVISSALLIVGWWGVENILRVMEGELVSKMRQAIVEHCMTLDYEVLERKETLEMIQRAGDSINSGGGIRNFYNNLTSFIEYLITIITSVVVLIPLFVPVTKKVSGLTGFLNGWYSGLILMCIILVSVVFRYLLARRRSRIEQKQFEKNIDLNREFGYFFNIIFRYRTGKDIRLYRMQDRILNGLSENAKGIENNGKWMMKGLRPDSIWKNAVSYILLLSTYVYVGLKVICRLISLGNVMKYVTAITRMSDSLGSIMESYNALHIRGKYVSYYYDFLNIRNEKYEGTLPLEKRDDNEYLLEFKDVSFHYPNQKDMVLSHVSMKFTVGEKMAIVGPNGAGKSTFIKLLCRLYDPTEGEILLNGIDIKLYDYEEYMRIFSIVFQDYRLFSFPLAENVAASMEYDSEKVKRSLVEAGFEKQLEKFDDGIHTNLYQMKEKGIEISGGEAQKIALARALYKDAAIVILDEPTSALDPVSEFEIYKRFDEMVQGKTSIYISHRMSSCRFCNRILVFDKGKIIQQGSHEQLMSQTDKLYAKLWEAQAQYYK